MFASTGLLVGWSAERNGCLCDPLGSVHLRYGVPGLGRADRGCLFRLRFICGVAIWFPICPVSRAKTLPNGW